MDEQHAIALLKQGDLTGMEFLVQQHQAKAVQTAYLIIGDIALAEDAVQIVFLRIVQKINQFDVQRPFQPWFLRAVVNEALKTAKRQERTVSLDGSSEAIINWLLDTSPMPEELAETSDLRQMVWSALQQLAPEQRAVIIQRHFLEMAEAEMVEKLQRPASTVKWRLRTAGERLKALLGDYRNEASGENHEKR
jgi:RNA polymerase sigma-70 factor, ECF subfamily